MTDDHTPIELSWKWSPSHKLPTVRYSIDPIPGKLDNFNTRATNELLKKILPSASSIELRWYDKLVDMLTTTTAEANGENPFQSDIALSKLPHSQQFLAFDLEKNIKNNSRNIMPKAYFLPQWKALLNAESTFSLVQSSIKTLSAYHPDALLYESWNLVADYIQSFKSDPGRPQVEIEALDCIDPSQSRIKIYLRSSRTKFNDVLDMMTLGGQISTHIQGALLESLKSIWCSVLSLEEKDLDADLPVNNHRTAGILYLAELRPGCHVPKIKVYIPAKHYGKNDLSVAQGISTFLSSRGNSFADGSDYLTGAKQLCHHRNLEDGLGFHTYVSAAVDENGLDVTTYFNPEIYHESRKLAT
ncbi:hypothetical protein ZTR_10298 [Talaromyces verruculosus]|nr:hypothetical protein ZTR_10298 [Talaromyces verruculosus]